MVWAERGERRGKHTVLQSRHTVFESRHGNSAGKCGEYQFLNGSTDGGMKAIASGVEEWVTLASDGTWGPWLQREWSPLRDCWFQQGNETCRNDPACPKQQALLVDALMCAGKKRRAMTSFNGTVSNQTLAASKLLNLIIVMEDFLYPLGGLGKIGIKRHPRLVASFGPDGKMQALGQIEFNATQGTVKLHTAVTRYTMSYDVKGPRTGSMKSAGKSLVGGFLEASSLQGTTNNLMFCTRPADTFVRKHYISNGAQMACGPSSKKTNDECTSMMQDGKNCDCEVCLCILAKCVLYFQASQCDLKLSDKGWGLYHGCFSYQGKFKGTC